MSKVQLQGNASGTGIFTIASPNSNTDRTLTLPDSSGTIATTGQAVTSAQLPAGTIIQAVYAQRSANEVYTNSTTAVTTNLTASITPRSTSSRIMIIGSLCLRADGGDTNTGFIDLYRNGSAIFTAICKWAANSVDSQQIAQYIDSPSSSSSVTYAFFIKSAGSSSDVRFNPASSGDANSTIILLEIAG